METKVKESEENLPLFDEDEEQTLNDLQAHDGNERVRYSFKAINYYANLIEQSEKDKEAYLAAINREAASVKSHYEKMRQRAETRIEVHLSSLWAIAKERNLPNLATPYGTVFARKTKPKVEYADEGALLEWLRGNYPDAIRKSEAVDKRILHEIITKLSIPWDTVPGVNIVQPAQPEELSYRLKETS